MLLDQLRHAPPNDESTAREWHEWKNSALSTSMRIFIERHPWFAFKKQDIYNKLNNFCSIPEIITTTRPGTDLSSVLPKSLELMVFKKSVGHSSKDVHVLRRSKEEGKFDCFLTKTVVSMDDLQSWANSNECIVEQSLSTFQEVIPLDFKCYIVDGTVKYVGVINRNATKPFLSYFDATNKKQIAFSEIFSDVPKNWYEGFGPYAPELFHRIELAKNEAERIARNALDVNGIILSLDMYVTPSTDGFTVWLGEITPRPGAIHSNWLKRNFTKNLFELTSK